MTEAFRTISPVKVKTQMKRSLFSTSSFRAYFIASVSLQDVSQIFKSVETNHFIFLGIGLAFTSSISGLLAVYFLTPFIMEKKYYISHDCANLAIIAMHYYKCMIDLHNESSSLKIINRLDSASNEIWSQSKTKNSTDKRPAK